MITVVKRRIALTLVEVFRDVKGKPVVRCL